MMVYVDIDGTLTRDGSRRDGELWPEMIEAVRSMIESGERVVIWSGNGEVYATNFCKKHGLKPAFCLGKPRLCIDDNPTIRPLNRMKIISPNEFLGK